MGTPVPVLCILHFALPTTSRHRTSPPPPSYEMKFTAVLSHICVYSSFLKTHFLKKMSANHIFSKINRVCIKLSVCV
ncbi:hypothetical protein PF005_g21399 [Phytophthora fragariae]|uniref:Uncharacterized protein n=1 Tax=Phytophthora fragariae TaxID=53985 RepID=A0A6A3QXF1_9STRA|nr:hypothetical protein PF003_g24109 [Phytophthora fragariae]KAE8927504.1 hypothetical protein PF009_g22336 [Phytophthora fragariae]KAE9078029.1 hypothetical protein PF006_g27799 [Phytophthora fragariae]KAE9084835.1 hypothetical protein PF007_g21373 [Phytophthora fragariae]KAE9175363.1 hypothetical protein PF002_g28810 [Phytophthora fragariae]